MSMTATISDSDRAISNADRTSVNSRGPDLTTMAQQNTIDSFLFLVRNRLNRFLLLDCFAWSLATIAALLTIVSLVYVCRGHAVPRFWYGLSAGGVLLATLFVWIMRLWTKRNAANYADEFFQLKDSLGSFLYFRSAEWKWAGDFLQLQEKATAQQIEQLDPSSIQYRWPKRIIALALSLAFVSVSIAFVDASPAVIERQLIETETTATTEQINEILKELVDDLEQEAELEENDSIDTEELREWVKELKGTSDQKAAMRQYAQLERKLNAAANRLDQRKNEELLSKAGEELNRNTENRQLGQSLEEKKYRDAADELEAMKLSNPASSTLSEQEKELARLKSAAQRMAAAVKAKNRQSSPITRNGRKTKPEFESPPQAKGRPDNSEVDNPEKSTLEKTHRGERNPGKENPQIKKQDSNPESSSLSDKILALETSVQKFETSLANLKMAPNELDKLTQEEPSSEQSGKPGENSPEAMPNLENNRNDVQSAIDELAQSLRQTASKRESRMKLQELSDKAGRMQQFLGQKPTPGQSAASNIRQAMGKGGKGQGKGEGQGQGNGRGEGQGNGLVQGNGKGEGQGIGEGAVQSRRNQRDALIDNGNITQLRGTIGAGPSQTTTEEASEGSGVSTRRSERRTREFSEQVESFVQREDIPENVKRGVKEYFENIHQHN